MDNNANIGIPKAPDTVPSTSFVANNQGILQPQEKIVEQKRPKSWVKISLLSIVVVVILFIGGLVAYMKYHLTYIDSPYGFVLVDQRDWYSVPKKEGVYYSLGTTNGSSKQVVSYFGVSPIAHSPSAPNDLASVKKLCLDDLQGTSSKLLDTSPIALNGLQGFLCVSEGKPMLVDAIYTQKNYIFTNTGHKYDYLIFTSFPKGDTIEEAKVNRIVNNFFAL